MKKLTSEHTLSADNCSPEKSALNKTHIDSNQITGVLIKLPITVSADSSCLQFGNEKCRTFYLDLINVLETIFLGSVTVIMELSDFVSGTRLGQRFSHWIEG